MSRSLLYAIVFIEGFCSLGAEVIALRRLLPYVGSSIVITAPTIGFFLLALALGYAAGGRVASDYRRIVSRNFLISALLCGAGMAGASVDLVFSHLQPAPVAYLFFVGGVLCPLAWLLGQTVPILTNLLPAERTGEASGLALYWSTLGSFLGSISLSLLVMQWLGVSAAVFACAAGLVIGALLLAGKRWTMVAMGGAATLIAADFNLRQVVTAETAYAEYHVAPVQREGQSKARAFWVNKSLASLLEDGEPPRYTRYIEHLRTVLLDELGYRDKEILVLGAGGFTLSHQEKHNRYTYVDIDPEIAGIAEKHFLHQPAQGEFLADDARRYVNTTERRFDAVIVDVFSAHTAIPGHLVTREFWSELRRVLRPEGVVLANLILDGKLETPYARNLLGTVEEVFGRCAVEVLHKGKPLANVELTCFASSQPARRQTYRDDHNRVDLDQAKSH